MVGTRLHRQLLERRAVGRSRIDLELRVTDFPSGRFCARRSPMSCDANACSRVMGVRDLRMAIRGSGGVGATGAVAPSCVSVAA